MATKRNVKITYFKTALQFVTCCEKLSFLHPVVHFYLKRRTHEVFCQSHLDDDDDNSNNNNLTCSKSTIKDHAIQNVYDIYLCLSSVFWRVQSTINIISEHCLTIYHNNVCEFTKYFVTKILTKMSLRSIPLLDCKYISAVIVTVFLCALYNLLMQQISVIGFISF